MVRVRVQFGVDLVGVVTMRVDVDDAAIVSMHMNVDPLAPHPEQDVAAQGNEHHTNASLEPGRSRNGEAKADGQGAHREQRNRVADAPRDATDDRRQAIAHTSRHADDRREMIRLGGVAHAQEEAEEENGEPRHAARRRARLPPLGRCQDARSSFA